jgi:hypothetical protein
VRASTASRILVWVVVALGVAALLSIVRGEPNAREAVAGSVRRDRDRRVAVARPPLPRGSAPGVVQDQAEEAGLRAEPGIAGLLGSRSLFGRAALRRAIERRRPASAAAGTSSPTAGTRPATRLTRRLPALHLRARTLSGDLSVVPEGLAARLRSTFALPDVELESEEFNRRFEVRSSDRRFAGALLDARMMRWLLDEPAGPGFEVVDARLMVFRPRATTSLDDVARALELSDAFAERIPRVVRAGPL